MKNTIDISVVIPIYNEEDVLNELYRRLISVLESISKDYEIIFVDDASKDNSMDYKVIGFVKTKNNDL